MNYTDKEIQLMQEAFKAGCEIQSVAECKYKAQIKTFWGWKPAFGPEVLDTTTNFNNWLSYKTAKKLRNTLELNL